MLWRLHLVHHSDTQLDVTTAERHHPLEAIPSIVLMSALILLFGLSPVGVGVYVLAATVVSFCSHANLCLPESYDRILRRLIVTPTFHAVHHSSLRAETNANYGFSVLFLGPNVRHLYRSAEGEDSLFRLSTFIANRIADSFARCCSLSFIRRTWPIWNAKPLRSALHRLPPLFRSRGEVHYWEDWLGACLPPWCYGRRLFMSPLFGPAKPTNTLGWSYRWRCICSRANMETGCS